MASAYWTIGGVWILRPLGIQQLLGCIREGCLCSLQLTFTDPKHGFTSAWSGCCTPCVLCLPFWHVPGEATDFKNWSLAWSIWRKTTLQIIMQLTGILPRRSLQCRLLSYLTSASTWNCRFCHRIEVETGNVKLRDLYSKQRVPSPGILGTLRIFEYS